jgi:hypothetical protein
MGLLDTLTQMVAGGNVSDHHFDQVAKTASPETMGGAIAGAFRSSETPPIGQMVGQLFGNSNPQQQSGLLNQLLSSLGPVAASALAGGALSKIMSPGATQVTPEQAAKMTPEQVQAVVTHANDAHPGIADQLGGFYAQHSGLIKTLGGVAMLVALSKMKDQLGSR